MNLNLVKRIIDWTLFAVTLAYIITGLGITQYRIVEPLTLGLLSKNLPFKMHEVLLFPFLTFLSLHLFFRMVSWIYSKSKGKKESD